ncbi:Ankyrin repeat family protein [Euphorbia peplus]|nr:Ankyrin repeat family protein [Euphorbia peplus]
MTNASSSTIAGSDDADLYIDSKLYKAATNGDFEMFKNYIQPLDHLLSQNKNTILHVHLKSLGERSKEFVEKVLGQCPRLLWKTNNDGAIPLHIAATYGHLDIVQVFIEEAKKPIHRDLETREEAADSIKRMLRKANKQKETALHLAIRNGCFDAVQEILKHEDPHFKYTANVSGETPLYLAICSNDGAATDILKNFESPDCGGPNGRTAFHAAAACHYFVDDDLLDLLLSKLGNFVNQSDESGWTPLHYAAYLDSSQVATRILGRDKSSAYATEKDKLRTALHIASCRGSVDTMEEIIDKCPECCEITDVRGWNVLHYAVLGKSEEAVKAILKNASLMYLLKEPDIKGYTPLNLLLASDYSSSLLSWILRRNFQRTRLVNTTLSDIDRDRENENVLEWMKDLGGGPLGNTFELKKVTKDWKEVQIEREEKIIPELEKAKESHLVAAALVATVTFAAAFTLPGGYISDENNPNLKGTPILSRNAAFKAFVVTDAIAMVLSTSSVFIHFLLVMLGYKRRYYWLIRSAFWFIVVAMGAMVVAFVTGTYAVLAPPSKGLAIVICVIGLTFFLHAAYATIRLIVDFVKRERVEHRGLSIMQSIFRVLRSAPQHLSCGCD